MKKSVTKKVLITAMVLLLGLFITTSATAEITGSAHDFSGSGWNSTGEMCVVCHTPHSSDTSVTDGPLWNHATTSAVFTTYSSSTMDATVTGPGSRSKLCLSCHDGTVALDSFGGYTGTTNYITGNALIGTDLSNDHPVSFTYDSSLATTDGGLYDPTTANSGLGGTIDADLLFNTQLECSSCHDAHNSAGVANLLVKANSGSALCMTCHNK